MLRSFYRPNAKSKFISQLKPCTGGSTISLFSSAVSVTTIVTTLQKCNSLFQAKLIHQQLLVHGLYRDFSTRLVWAYLALDAPSYSISILERLTPSSSAVICWNALIRRSLRLGFSRDVLSLFRRMLRLRRAPDHYIFPSVLKACGELTSFRSGASVHGVISTIGLDSNVFICNAMVAMYARCGELDDARKMFEEMRERGVCDIVSWNSIVAAYMQSGDAKNAVELFRRMTSDLEIRPDGFSLVNVLPACGSLGASLHGMQLHGFAVRRGLFEDVFVGNALMDMYAKCGMIEQANKVFERMEVKDVVSWNAMVTGYSQVGRFEEALGLFEKMKEENIELDVVTWSSVIASFAQQDRGYEALSVFRQMQVCGSKPNVVTLVSVLSGCASIAALIQGKEIHGFVIKSVLNYDWNDPGEDLKVINGLIDMYAKCESTNVARFMFDSVAPSNRNVVTWTVMIGGYAQHGEANDALKLFSEMFQDGNSKKPNTSTICCALMACAHLAALRFGKQIHAYMLRNQYESEMLFMENCLIDMYSKSGNIHAARVVFDNMQHKNSVSWTSLLTGYGMHGYGDEAIKVLGDMRAAGFVLDGITFLVLLYVCSHSGMVDQGIRFFESMHTEYDVIPGLEHYACAVDLLGRAGRFDQALKLIHSMPMEPTAIVWIVLLSGCRIHGNVELGEYAAAKLRELGSENDASYTLLSNMYANARRWRDVARVRSLMKYSGVKRRPGCSWVEGKKGTATFYAGDRSHPHFEQIYELLADLIQRIKAIGYVPDTNCALHDVDDKEKGDLLSEHSEKLALAYGILISIPGAPIHITKNLRVCSDCHNAITYISMIIDNEIILRDSSRFHHFKNGSCSCRGYW
ncbi:Pentatricopeptide repeat-containing protein [Hibiscus syriacus]|uniref:Pentatricopeptide repeat-containing protein n=1 Tax=Hibiscus syriacus TaxID=106335 RepID=A0A6A3BUA6_HIBSY|nr:pentatricopeptide repeat-containing protein At5g16860-like [Hibiscus syriacus]KAE8718459.1 Pentatricopeptide repeat-containing protein [Hibiscus syriacus]